MADQQKFYELLNAFDVAMLTTFDSSNLRLHSRPMAIARVDDNCDVWFITGYETAKSHEIESNAAALITCQNGRARFLSLNGSATLLRDGAKVQAVWKEPFKVWFPEGPTDPNIALIHVKAQSGEYWDNEGLQGLQYMFDAAKAYVTGTRPSVDKDESIHAKVTL